MRRYQRLLQGPHGLCPPPQLHEAEAAPLVELVHGILGIPEGEADKGIVNIPKFKSNIRATAMNPNMEQAVQKCLCTCYTKKRQRYEWPLTIT